MTGLGSRTQLHWLFSGAGDGGRRASRRERTQRRDHGPGDCASPAGQTSRLCHLGSRARSPAQHVPCGGFCGSTARRGAEALLRSRHLGRLQRGTLPCSALVAASWVAGDRRDSATVGHGSCWCARSRIGNSGSLDHPRAGRRACRGPNLRGRPLPLSLHLISKPAFRCRTAQRVTVRAVTVVAVSS